MTQEQQVLDQLKQIQDPDLKRDIVSLNFIKDLKIQNGDVSFKIELTTPACPVKEQFQKSAEQLVKQIEWVKEVNVMMSSQKPKAGISQSGNGLSNVQHIVAVASCKGGVGKSTVALNLAFTLSQMGASVGIFDADIYGPSLPTLINLPYEPLKMREKLIYPREFHGVKLQSFGYTMAPEESGPAIMRGPMVTQVINQLLSGTQWGELDYLILDLPPGTGDIQITLGQMIPLRAAVIVTTPQQLAYVDVVKGIQLFDVLRIPTIAVIENMSYFVCDSCDKRHEIFGRGAKQRLMDEFGFERAFEIPMDPKISSHGDGGVPYVIMNPSSAISEIYKELAQTSVKEIAKIAFGGQTKPKVSFAPLQGIVVATDTDRYVVSPFKLRLACKCALCQDEISGKNKVNENSVDPKIIPLTIQPVGNYAIGINWSDGHSSLFPYEALVMIESDVASIQTKN